MVDNIIPEEDNTDAHLNDHILPLRDRITKIETIVNYHDREFQEVKTSINDLTTSMENQHTAIIEKLEYHNKNFMDVLYSQTRDNEKNNTELRNSILHNKNTFDNWVSKWRAISWAVWFTICVTLSAVAWGFTTAKDLGLFEIVKQTNIEIVKQPK